MPGKRAYDGEHVGHAPLQAGELGGHAGLLIEHEQLDAVHEALTRMLAAKGARVDSFLCCVCERKNPRLKPAAGMLREALARFGAAATDTPFVGDQVEDLKAAFHAGCPRVLVRTGLGRKALEDGLPDYVQPVAVYDDLAAAVDAHLAQRR